jgi:hypothetical protein
MIPRNPGEDFDPNDTITQMVAFRARTHRPTRELVAAAPGVGAAGLVLWLAKLAGVHDIPPDVALYLGSLVTTAVSSVIRWRLGGADTLHKRSKRK